MPINYKYYPSNWLTEIRPFILRRDNYCCKKCGVRNHEKGARDIHGTWHSEKDINSMQSDVGWFLFKKPFPKIIKIVLTIAHLDHNIFNNHGSNLAALCQRCHLRHDARQHQATRKYKKYLHSLFPLPYTIQSEPFNKHKTHKNGKRKL